MSVLSKLTDFISGGLFKEIKETAMAYLPPKMSEEEIRQFEADLDAAAFDKEIRLQELLADAANQLDKRIAEQEGTAEDLRTIPILGPLMLFLRGCQRPIWGFATLVMDFKWLFETHNFTEQ